MQPRSQMPNLGSADQETVRHEHHLILMRGWFYYVNLQIKDIAEKLQVLRTCIARWARFSLLQKAFNTHTPSVHQSVLISDHRFNAECTTGTKTWTFPDTHLCVHALIRQGQLGARDAAVTRSCVLQGPLQKTSFRHAVRGIFEFTALCACVT